MSDMPKRSRALALSAAATLAFSIGCAEQVTGPSPARANLQLSRVDGGVVGEATASVRWSAIARDFFAAKPAAEKPNQQVAFRAFAYLSLAQYLAAVAAHDSRGHPPHASPSAAASAASALVLAALFPQDAGFFESQLSAQEGAAAAPPAGQGAFAAGEAIGRTVGMHVAELARTDRFDAVWTGTVPTGAGLWSSDFDPPRPPLLPLLGEMRPFYLTSGDQFRPGPPPAFGSSAYLAALAEVRQFSDHRTDDQLRIAEFWAMPTVAAFWNEQATTLITHHQLDERRAARVLALMHTATMDANIACHDAKYTYWLIRPYRADPAITTPIPRPQHPSYPSDHACVSGTSAYVLGALFPADAERLAALADEAGESRIYAGIHYRFDKDAGLHIARQVAALAVQRGLERSKVHQ
jgi:membrane-associated phospholipid phosphatase